MVQKEAPKFWKKWLHDYIYASGVLLLLKKEVWSYMLTDQACSCSCGHDCTLCRSYWQCVCTRIIIVVKIIEHAAMYSSRVPWYISSGSYYQCYMYVEKSPIFCLYIALRMWMWPAAWGWESWDCCNYGHDAFLVEIDGQSRIISRYLERIEKERNAWATIKEYA